MIKVLMVDPDIAFIVPVKRALEAMGDFTVRGFANGGAALEAAQADDFDIAVLDIHIDDVAIPYLVASLREHQPQIPVIVSSTEKTGALKVQAALPKPYYARQLGPLIQ